MWTRGPDKELPGKFAYELWDGNTMVERYGEKQARKIGVVAMEGGKDKVKNRNATPLDFRDVLIAMARSVTSDRLANKPRGSAPTNEGEQPDLFGVAA